MFEEELSADPIEQFSRWFETARAAGVQQPEAMALATTDSDGSPSVRFVLLKSWDAAGFTFFTNYESQKGTGLSSNPAAALAIYWQLQGRQVRVEGSAERVSDEDSDRYFQSRPRGSQISASISPQSRPVPSREWLRDAYRALESSSQELPLERPAHWGGFRIVPSVIEFWEHQDSRLHDRVVYRRMAEGGWRRERLAP